MEKTMRQVVFIIISFISVTLTNSASARIIFGPNQSFLQTDEATKNEIERIQKLAPSKSPVLNQASLNDARDAAESYSRYSDQIPRLEKISVDSAKKKVSEATDQLIRAVKECQRKQIAENLLIIKRQLAQFDGLFNFDGFPTYFPTQDEKILTDSEATTINEVTQFLQQEPEKICTQYKDKNDIDGIRTQLDSAVNIAATRLASHISDIKERSPRAKALSEAWGKYRDLLLKSIEDSEPATQVAGQLGVIIGVFCAFGILMFLAVRVFPADVQIELIASGQVIQFATVMVLLIVVCVLGMSKFLTENTLGTLLGGIGGYVLSQGVGRAVSRAAIRDSQSHQQQTGTNQ